MVTKGVFINTLVGGLGKMEGGQKRFWQKGDQKVFHSKRGSKKFGQIESIINIKMHNLLLKLAGYSLKLDISKFSRALQRARHCDLHLKCLHSHSRRNTWHLFRAKLCTIIQRVVVIPFHVLWPEGWWPVYQPCPPVKFIHNVQLGRLSL